MDQFFNFFIISCSFNICDILQSLLQRPSLPVHGLDPIPQRVVPSGGAAREVAAGTLGSLSGFPQLLRPKARIRRPFVASILRMSWHQLMACPAHIAGFVHGIRILAICSCGGISQICQWYRVCDAGALRAEPLATLYILRGQNFTTNSLAQCRAKKETRKLSALPPLHASN